MISVQVISKSSGKPSQGQRVSVSFNGITRGMAGPESTDSNGEVHFSNDPGPGEVYVNGRSEYKGRLQGRVVVYL